MTTYMMQAMDRSNRVTGVVQPLNRTALATIAARIHGAGVSEQHTAEALAGLQAMTECHWVAPNGQLAVIHKIDQ